ncbi:MAG: fibronectin type III domain-containing protein, partial [Bacteroidales bacterium]
MKKTIYLQILLTLLPLFVSKAQVIKENSKAICIEYPDNKTRATVLSRNGQYVALPTSAGTDILDLKTNKTSTHLRTEVSKITGIADNGVMCGHINLNPEGESFGSPRVYRDGKWQTLGLSYNAIRPDWPEFNYWRYLYPVAISADGKKIVGGLTYGGTWGKGVGGVECVIDIHMGGAIWDENGKLDSMIGCDFRSISGDGKVFGTNNGHIVRNDSLIQIGTTTDDMTMFLNQNGDKALLRDPYAVLGYSARLWENGQKDLLQIPLIKGYINHRGTAMSENGLVLGYVQKEENFLKRTSIWSKEMGNVFLSDYLRELYDLDSLSFLYEGYNISADGKVIVASFLDELDNPHPCIIKIIGEPSLSRPMEFMAKGFFNQPKARLLWEHPIYCGKYPINYRVYRNGAKIAELPISTLSYIDSLSPNGEQSYTVTAVYDNGESAPSEVKKVNILGANECQPIRFFSHTLDYNRNVNLYWHLPSANIAPNIAKLENAPSKSSSNFIAMDTNNPWEKVIKTGDYKFAGLYNMFDYTRVSVVRVGNYYYTSTDFFIPLYKSDLDFQNSTELKFPEGQHCPFSVDMTTDGTYIYGIKNASKLITVIDPELPAIVEQIKIK